MPYGSGGSTGSSMGGGEQNVDTNSLLAYQQRMKDAWMKQMAEAQQPPTAPPPAAAGPAPFQPAPMPSLGPPIYPNAGGGGSVGAALMGPGQPVAGPDLNWWMQKALGSAFNG